MKIGVTGTRNGMTSEQRVLLQAHLSEFPAGSELHHGDCVGVDAEVAAIARELGFRVICHPPEKNELRAFYESDESRTPYNYLRRDRNIVDETDQLLVVPMHTEWQPKGGTWYTHDYAKKKNKPLTIIWPGTTKNGSND